MFNLPILFLVFNRPDRTRLVFEEIKKIKPKYLYIAADGPRKDKVDEIAKCEEVRFLVQQIDWDCELKTLFRSENWGSGLGVYDAINWFFNQEEKGIILEDDCMPNQSFFYFCENMLNYYEKNESIMQISGSNYLLGFYKTRNYYFSQIPLTWGWATWRRAWKKMDYSMKDFEENYKKFPAVAGLWQEHWQNVLDGTISDAWDFQWYYSIYCNNGIVIHPSVNLVLNLGFNPVNATHTFKEPWWYKYIITKELNTINNYNEIIINQDADAFFKKIFSGGMPNLYQRVILKIRSYLL